MFKKALIAGAASLALTTAAFANSPLSPEQAVDYRQGIYKFLGGQSGYMAAMIKGEIPLDAAELNQRAKNIGFAGSLLGETYFPETKDVKGTKLRAKAWNEMDKFGAKAENFGEALQALIAGTDKASIDMKEARQLVGGLQRACKSCHDDYRAR